MKKMVFVIIALCAIGFTSCGEDERTGIEGFSNCPICHGKGYCEKSEFFGLVTSYWDCRLCAEKQNIGGYNPSFQGSRTGYTGECKECDCPAYDGSSDGICECGHYKTDHVWHN